jgi:hypothetical protein
MIVSLTWPEVKGALIALVVTAGIVHLAKFCFFQMRRKRRLNEQHRRFMAKLAEETGKSRRG